MKIWDPNLPRKTQFLWLSLAAVLFLYSLTVVKVFAPPPNWKVIATIQAEYAVHVEQSLKNYKTEIQVSPSLRDSEEIIVDIGFASFSPEEIANLEFLGIRAAPIGPLEEFIKAFTTQNFRYSQNLCHLAEEDFPGSGIQYVTINYYTISWDTEKDQKEYNLFFSESSNCHPPPKISLLTYLLSFTLNLDS